MAKKAGSRAAVEAARPAPRSPRGLRTRTALVEAARTVFERDGYLEARITDITKEAGVAAGSFYTYFDSKEEIFEAEVRVAHNPIRAYTMQRTHVRVR
ncbi:MAG: helix-turn-helix transcriptional regulator [Actinobacteria bacterium]|nr:helix-turn-helix transcriptional regulator [Actinomycetota bacterium]